MTADRIKELLVTIEGVDLIDDFSTDQTGLLSGSIAITIQEGARSFWDVEISPTYPFKAMGIEPIQFLNKDLIDYPHIMQRGNLCMHPAEYDDVESQFVCDLEQLKEWVEKYYVRGEKDEHYEHLVVNHYPIRDEYYSFCFAETQYDFEDGDYGLLYYSKLLKGWKQEKVVNNLIVQKFISCKQVKKVLNPCLISQTYQHMNSYDGVYCLLNDVPSVHNKFIVEDYDSIKGLFSQSQKDFIHLFEFSHRGKINYFPLFCGYRMPNGEVHWQAIMLFMDNLPIEPIRMGTGKKRIWHTDFKMGTIQWAQTENISYKYFFGRGAMPKELANKSVLIMGVGAIGSMVAETWTRCGAKLITLFDIDNKEPGNVCRSSYLFATGITEKTIELEGLLTQISPHLECASIKSIADLVIKTYAAKNKDEHALSGLFDQFDIVFDCTTDNQLMRIVDATGTKAQVINLSITNRAQDLVCAFSPNVTKIVQFVYALLNRDEESDLYNPSGCWNPTFKASYNDLSSKVQFAIRHIIKILCREEPINSFYITNDDLSLNIHRI